MTSSVIPFSLCITALVLVCVSQVLKSLTEHGLSFATGQAAGSIPGEKEISGKYQVRDCFPPGMGCMPCRGCLFMVGALPLSKLVTPTLPCAPSGMRWSPQLALWTAQRLLAIRLGCS